MSTGYGYGKAPYGFDPYGSVDTGAPRVIGAVSVDGFVIEVFFSEAMAINASFVSPASYLVQDVLGAAPSTVSSVAVGQTALGGALTALVTHTGTTLGGVYLVDVVGGLVSQAAGAGLISGTATLLAKGDPATFEILPQVGGTELIVQFSQDMVPTATFAGIEDVASYQIVTDYPIPLIVSSATHPNLGDDSQVSLVVAQQTAADYTATITPAEAITYAGDVLPDDPSNNFNGVEIGVGTSAVGTSGLLLNKPSGSVYGWAFEDTSGKLTDTSTFGSTLPFDLSASVISPLLSDLDFGSFHFYDGTTAIELVFTRVLGADIIRVLSGTFSQDVPLLWSDAPKTIAIVRNQLADSITFALDGQPFLTDLIANFTGTVSPLSNPGFGLILATSYSVAGFEISSFDLSASDTIFSSAWNFSHDLVDLFMGAPGPSRQVFPVEFGPLVKGWGDATPAGPEDVSVLVNGIRVGVASVNPYIGEITLEAPVPLFAPGGVTVTVDYVWFENPIFELSGLNTPGLVLNKWDRAQMSHPPVAAGSGLGAASSMRFPYSVVLGPSSRPAPLLVGHRFLAFDRKYTASLNSPTTLLLNQNPHAVAVPGMEALPESANISYEANEAPLDAEPPWDLEGVDSGSLEEGQSTYVLIDASAGSFEEGTSAFYSQMIDLSLPSSVVLVARMLVQDFVADGVFTGIGFGLHDNRRLYLVGALEINGVRHLGILKDEARVEERSAWTLGPTLAVEILDNDTFVVDTLIWPALVKEGARFQIFDSNQAGVYSLGSFTHRSDGKTEVTVQSPGFPFDPALFGGRYVDIVLEVEWDAALSTYRFQVDPDRGVAELSFSGSLASLVLTSSQVARVALPPESPLTFDLEGAGQAFWGSLSRRATNTSQWTFLRYGVTPDQRAFHTRGIIVSSEMGEVPEDDPNSEWDRLGDFGFSEIDFSGDTLLLKSTSASETLGLTFGYRRVEPFLTVDVFSEFDATFRVDNGTLGCGDARLTVNDKNKEATLATLTYTEGGSPFRQLTTMPWVSLSGLLTPTSDGWVDDLGVVNALQTEVNGQLLTISQEAPLIGLTQGLWSKDLPQFVPFEGTSVDISSTVYQGRTLEARVRVVSVTSSSSGVTGLVFKTDSGTGAIFRIVAFTLLDAWGANPQRIALLDTTVAAAAPVVTYPLQWNDGEFHTYRLLIDPVANTVTVVVDDTTIGVEPWTSFALSVGPSITTETVSFGIRKSVGPMVVELDSFSVAADYTTNEKRTLGVFLGGDAADINNWQIPRTDTTGKTNDSNLAVVEEMDWRADVQVRVHRDPNWGITVFRPDLPPPPYWDGSFATDITEASKGWINVEYRHLPRQADTFGSFSWGALDPRSLSQQRWGNVRYRVYNHKDQDYIAPQYHVLNKFNMINSGEPVLDVTPEVVAILSETATLIKLSATSMFADRVFNVIEGVQLLPHETWTFDKETQTITLTVPLEGERVPVTVTFAPSSDMVTKTYLESQPLENSVTLLNEGTPSFFRHQTGDANRVELWGSTLNDPNSVLNDPDFILNDPFRYVDFVDDTDAQLACAEFFTVDNGQQTGLITSICDNPAPGRGLLEIGLEGIGFEESFPKPQDGFYGTAGLGCFTLSGGAFEESLLAPDPGARDVLCPGYAPGLATDPNAKPVNVPVTITIEDGGVTTTYYLFG